MKWSKAIEIVDRALSEDMTVTITYHRKWCRNTNEIKTDEVEAVVSYEWNGENCKAVNTLHDQLNEGCYIIEEITVK